MRDSCPISNYQINEKIARCNAFFILLAILAFFLSKNTFIVAAMVIDFFIRGFLPLNYSPASFLSRNLLNSLKSKPKLVNAGPKIFAAKVGFFMSALILLFYLTPSHIGCYILAGLIAVCAFLEAFLGYCVGCQLYLILHNIKPRP